MHTTIFLKQAYDYGFAQALKEAGVNKIARPLMTPAQWEALKKTRNAAAMVAKKKPVLPVKKLLNYGGEMVNEVDPNTLMSTLHRMPMPSSGIPNIQVARNFRPRV
jgi:hypothetical protein